MHTWMHVIADLQFFAKVMPGKLQGQCGNIVAVDFSLQYAGSVKQIQCHISHISALKHSCFKSAAMEQCHAGKYDFQTVQKIQRTICSRQPQKLHGTLDIVLTWFIFRIFSEIRHFLD